MARQTPCSNCGEKAALPQMLTVTADNMLIAKICPTCQCAKKIQITLEKDEATGTWRYYQYFPVEA